jgi:heat shock protein HslJ
MKTRLLILLIIVLTITACTAQGIEDPASSLIGTWKLTGYGSPDSPTPAVADAEANLTFNLDGSVGGNSGCNGFGGSYTVEGDQVTFSDIVSTLMACDDPRMAQEDAVHKVLADTATYKIEGNTLTLTNDALVLVLTR